ncbi:MAG: DUF1846 domain-containing protein [Clostridia bacterium]|nr:DUF1846 domain-containing protein [Clostridia bacterium]
MQSEQIKKRIAQFGGKLYLEFGGKLFDDYHASRVLPGFEPDSKIRMLQQLKDDLEIVITINAEDIQANKTRGDLGITYDNDVLRLIDTFREMGLYVGGVVLTRFNEQPQANAFYNLLEKRGIRCYRHYTIAGYPSDIPHIVSEEGLGKNEYIETTHSLVVITAPGPGSGKMATCLSQLYHDYKRGIAAGYAKFETFPVWNLPLNHPVNLAYEAATADLNDVNMIDPFHYDAYGEVAVNYNRDVEIFPVLNTIFEKIQGSSPYKSPTDMGVNMAGNCILDDEACRDASKREIIRRYFAASTEAFRGKGSDNQVEKIKLLMNQVGITPEYSPAVPRALEKETETGAPAAAMVLPDGRMVTGKTSDTLGAASALLLNALKLLGGIDKPTHLISAHVLEPICNLKTEYLKNKNPRLHTDEILIALTISALNSDVARKAKEQLKNLRGSDAHFTVILSAEDEKVLKKLGINVSYEAKHENGKLYY